MLGADGSVRRRRIPLRIFLSLVIVATLLPPLSLLAMVVVRTAETDRAAAELSLVDDAKVIASMVHGALVSDAQILDTIGSHITKDDFSYGNELELINEHFKGWSVILTSTAGETQTGWSISNLIDIRPGERANLMFSIPHNDGSGDILQVTADSTAISSKISFGTMQNQLVAVVDGNGNMITRSVAAEENLGKRVPTWEALLSVGAPSGSFKAVAFDGTPISFGFSSIDGTPGWVVVVGLPQAVLDARWQTPLIAFGVGVAIALLLAVLLSFLMARRITRPIEAMVERSEAIALDTKGDLPPAPETNVEELATLYNAQINSHTRLLQRAEELELSSQRYFAVARVGAMVTWRADRYGNILDIEGWTEFTGQHARAALGRGWVERVHGEDMLTLTETLDAAARDNSATATAEVRVKTDLHGWVWVNFRGAKITDSSGKAVEWVGTLENIDDRKRLQLRISHMAYHDALTGLPNRIRLAEHFEELWQTHNSGQNCALLYIDLDKFKQANDTFGHATGDALLREVAMRLQSVLRAHDMAARLGGDEFAVVLGALENVEYSTTVASRIVRSLSVPFEIDGHVVEIGASVGVAPFKAGTVSIERLQFEADSALYRAKTGGRNRWSFNVPSDDEQPNRA
jgi:diguanylate cyclase (GGDEF)-like protein/PAS domain S-box-containing protein